MLRLALVLVAAVGSSASMAAAPCFDYNKPVTLTGYVGTVTFPGQPNYEDVRHGDAKETVQVLFIGEPICTNGDDISDSVTAIAALQLACGKDFTKRAGSPVTIAGTLYGAISGHHHTAVLLECH